MKIQIFLLFPLTTITAILADLVGDGGNIKKTRNVFIKMKQGPGSILSSINSQRFNSRGDKITALTNALQAHSTLTQLPLTQFLSSPLAGMLGLPTSSKSFWSSNEIFLEGVNAAFFNTMTSTFSNLIDSVRDESIAHLSPHIPAETDVDETINAKDDDDEAWGVHAIGAPTAWEYGIDGTGIVVGVIDGGVQKNHEALRENYRESYGWFDATTTRKFRSRTPSDGDGHGTHCAGSILGTKRKIGVAPGAKWIACKGCGKVDCTENHLKSCMEFMACPTDIYGRNMDCSKAPHIVSNSWGGSGGHTNYDSLIEVWHSAKIIPIFSAGNNGPKCSGIGYPGDSPRVIGVGASNNSSQLASFSSKGPSVSGLMKPDLTAPGDDILSAAISTRRNNKYVKLSGTSMSCPYVAGLAALILQQNPDMEYDDLKARLIDGCINEGLQPNCQRCPASDSGRYKFPNNDWGQGLVNAPRSLGFPSK